MLLLLCYYFVTGSIARSESRRYLIYSILRFFAPQGRHVAPMGVKFGKFHSHRSNDKGIGPQKLKFLLRFHQNVEHKLKRPAGAYPLRDFHNIYRMCTPFQDAFAAKTWLDLLEGLWSYGDFKLRGSGFPQIFRAPGGETVRQTPKSFRGARTCSRSSIPMPSLVGLGFHQQPGWPKTLSFLSVCLFVALLNVRVCAPDFAMKALEYRNDFDAVG